MVQFHLIMVSLWLGLIAGETTMEMMAKGQDQRRFVAQVHRVIDLLFEGPLIVLILGSGGVLLFQNWEEASALLLVKAGLGVIALTANIVCLHYVLQRAKEADYAAFKSLSRKISLTGTAIPLGALVFAIGLFGV